MWWLVLGLRFLRDGEYLGIGIGGDGRKVPDDESAIGEVEGREEKRLMSGSEATTAIDNESTKQKHTKKDNSISLLGDTSLSETHQTKTQLNCLNQIYTELFKPNLILN